MRFSNLLVESEGTVGKHSSTTAFIKHTEDQGGRSSNYDLCYSKTGVEPINPKRKAEVTVGKDFQRIATAEVVNRLLREASDTVTKFLTVEGPIEQANLAFTFKGCLEDLWEHRRLREDNWGDLLNILQAVLAQVEFEQLSCSQKLGIKKVVSEYLCKAGVTDADSEEALDVLSDAGFDPWRGISGKPQE